MDRLSERAKVSRDWKGFPDMYSYVCRSSPYHEICNPGGFVNLGTAANNLCNEITHSRLINKWTFDFESFEYVERRGSLELRKVMASFMTEFLESYEAVCPENLFCLTGVNSCITLLAHCLADPGEVFLVPTPMSDCIYRDCMQRSLVDVFPIYLISEDDRDENSRLTIEKIICAYERALITDNIVRGILLINPNSPLGDIYSPELLMDIMSFCYSKSLHLIVDEIYALSAFSKTEKFHSILKFPSLPDPDRIHVIYGLSKDFGVPGLKIGVIHTKCKELHKSLMELSYFHAIPCPVMKITAEFLEDMEWCKEYITTYRDRLAENYNYCAKHLDKIGVKVRRCAAGFSLWMDLRHLCGSSFEEEKNFFNYLLCNAHLYIGAGEEFFCAQPGWFRIVFSQNDSDLVEGMKRFKVALQAYKSEKTDKPKKTENFANYMEVSD